MENETDKPTEPKGDQGLSPFALFLAFAPSALLFLTFSSGLSRMFEGASRSTNLAFVWLACFVTVACCLCSSYLMFRRGTAASIVGGLLLLLLNGFIAFFLGCSASLNR